MIHHIHQNLQTSTQSHGRSQLEAAITSSLLDGELKPGDMVSGPDALSQNFQIPLSEVLESISHMLAQRIFTQDNSGNLFIHICAIPTLEMRQQAFVVRARQLMDIARKWELPNGCIEPLISSAAQQVA